MAWRFVGGVSCHKIRWSSSHEVAYQNQQITKVFCLRGSFDTCACTLVQVYEPTSTALLNHRFSFVPFTFPFSYLLVYCLLIYWFTYFPVYLSPCPPPSPSCAHAVNEGLQSSVQMNIAGVMVFSARGWCCHFWLPHLSSRQHSHTSISRAICLRWKSFQAS